MSEGIEPKATAGALLRAAREKQGLHIAALAAAIKVSPRKLDALEHDRYDELPDATFTRALAQTVCRSLKIEAAPVLALLPQAEAVSLDHVAGTLNTPFRDRASRGEPGGLAAAAIRPMVGAGVALLVAAAVVYFVPAEVWQFGKGAATIALPTAASAPEPVPAPAPLALPEVASAPVMAAASAPEAGASAVAMPVVALATPAPVEASAPEAPRLVQLRAERESWVEARDSRGQVLFSRLVQPGEAVGFDGQLPIRLTIGNAPATRLRFKGQPVELATSTRDNVARLELQ